MAQRNPLRNIVALQDAMNQSTRRARALARVLQTAATSSTGVENEELVEVADILVSELDKVIAAKEGVYQASRSVRVPKTGK